MIRTFLARGDRAESAVITEGLDSITCSNPPPEVQIATLGMKTYCSACKEEGYIAPRGPRWPGTGPNGKQWALSGDINICGCNPPPIFRPIRERHMTMSFTADEAARLMAPSSTNVARTNTPEGHWISFVLTERGACSGLRCAAHFEDGSEQWGTFDANNTVRFERYENGSRCTHVDFLFDNDMNPSGSVAQSLLSAITGGI
ncbi:hypothetical protein [Paraburkholderia silvatlantica]|uniref:hypothetical protein n=1 Tax=Paraburkholderia silvatlantica TaxID=321895 RepID=UPI00375014F4